MSQILIQNIGTDAGDLNIDDVADASYSEHLDPIGGVQLCFVANNRFAYLTDIVGLKSGDKITAVLGNNEDFSVKSEYRITEIRSLENHEKLVRNIPIENPNYVMVECIDEVNYQLHQSGNALFHGDTVKTILSKTLPAGVQIETSQYPVVPAYSCFGMKKSTMLLKMCQELASFAWYQDGKFTFKKYDDVWGQDTSVTVEYNTVTPESEESVKITEMFPIKVTAITLDKLKKHYLGYNHTDGFIESKYFKGFPQVVTDHSSTRILNNLARAWYPVNSMTTKGSSLLRVGKTCKQRFYTTNLERPIDESIEYKVIISDVTHYSIGMEHICRVSAIKLLKME